MSNIDKKIQITIEYPWDDNGPIDIEEIRDKMLDWSESELYVSINEADIKLINEKVELKKKE